jgi:alkylation response protein AidB-like acyl-CoA dehydrogenase
MNLSLSEDQLMLKDSVARFVRDHCGVEVHRRLRDSGRYHAPDIWRQMAELGWLGLPFAEEDGGYGGGAAEVMVLMEELGRGLVVQPYVATVLTCGRLLARCEATVRQRYLPGLMAGERLWALAFAEPAGRYQLEARECRAQPGDGGHRLSGTKIAVINGALAQSLLVSACLPDGTTALFVLPEAGAARRREVALVDGTTGAEITFEETPAELVSSDGAMLLGELMDELILALAAQGLGSMEMLLETTVEYCKTRQQFGQPIGRFQALQHRMADMYVQCQTTRSLLYDAVLAHTENRPDKAQASSALKVKLGEAGRYVSQQAVQLHGGMGMTDELAVSHHFKALLLLNVLFGDSDYHLDRYLALSA